MGEQLTEPGVENDWRDLIELFWVAWSLSTVVGGEISLNG